MTIYVASPAPSFCTSPDYDKWRDKQVEELAEFVIRTWNANPKRSGLSRCDFDDAMEVEAEKNDCTRKQRREAVGRLNSYWFDVVSYMGGYRFAEKYKKNLEQSYTSGKYKLVRTKFKIEKGKK